ncbi:small ubiquitin-related modifier-like [Daktulosphaira vitifoliae]|uniref:small ubiquitin-related modifier-like n=1 Tax=Daktulosphaira vitifoliae TaxID=58002 RepID=UPI0021A9D085|nr:small ubiquitin-related modifier-like [Daktulosphaira vitifoliae]
MSCGEEETSKSLESTSKDNGAKKQNELSSASIGGESSGSGTVGLDDKVSSEEYIRLRVITSDMTNEVHFRVKSATALGRLKRSYCSKLGFQVEELRFVFDGHRITDDDTPKKLGMMNDDVIEIYQERTGGKLP